MPPRAIVELRETWLPNGSGALDQVEYAYELRDHERDFRQAHHLHDRDVFVHRFSVVVHEHCERPIGRVECAHYEGSPIRDAFAGVVALVEAWTARPAGLLGAALPGVSRSPAPREQMAPSRTTCKSGAMAVTYNQMVVFEAENEEGLNQLFRALADGTRRDILARSLTETPSGSDLAAGYEMSFAAVQKHVAVLERAGLIRSVQTGGSNWSPPTQHGSGGLAAPRPVRIHLAPAHGAARRSTANEREVTMPLTSVTKDPARSP